MKKLRFTEEQMAYALKQAELGTAVGEICRKMGVSEATFYVWRKKYGGLGPSELKRLRLLEDENRKLKQLVADLSLDKAMLQEVVTKKQSSEAYPEAQMGRPTAGAFWCKRATRAANHVDVAIVIFLSSQGTRLQCDPAADARDHTDAHSLRL